MPIKSMKLFPLIIILVMALLLVLGCGKQGSRFPNQLPSIRITSFEGYDPDNPFTDSTAVTSFQQKIFWHATDPDGVITGFAYRIINEAGDPISTAGNAFVDTDGAVTPPEVLEKFGAGWVLHYKTGADQDLSLNDPAAKRTIWSTQKYATVNFLAATAEGIPDTTISRFEVICIDNRGDVCETLAYRRFKSTSGTPTCFVSTTRGDPNGGQVGTGIRLSFTLDDTDPFIQPKAWYYKFKVQKVSNASNAVIPDSTYDVNAWYTTRDLADVNRYLLTKYTTPRLTSDFDAQNVNVQVSYTRVVASVIDMAGIHSEPDTITFAVKEGFHPGTLVYMKRTYALGTNHCVDYVDESTSEVWPYTIVNDEQLFATNFFKDINEDYTLVHSQNLKSWIRWGWHGEYALQTAGGSTITTDDPYDKKVDELLDEDTDTNYYSEITHFDLRLNGEPYNYPPLKDSIHIDPGTLKRWLRVPVNSSLGQTIVLANLPINTPENPYHLFEVRAVDLQNEIDPTPYEFKFKIAPPIPKEQKQGVLVIDDDEPSNNFSPGAIVDSLWNSYFDGTSYTPTIVHYKNEMFADSKQRKLALSDLQHYKLVIFHSERPDKTPNIIYENDGINLYLRQGGNMAITMTGQGSQGINAFVRNGQKTLNRFFGVPYLYDIVQCITAFSNAYFIKAVGQEVGGYTYPDADVNISGFNNVVNTYHGLYSVSYFPTFLTGTNVLYKFGCKPTNYQYYPPSQANFNLLNNQPVALRKATENNKCYLIGFPLTYMETEDAAAIVNRILTETM